MTNGVVVHKLPCGCDVHVGHDSGDRRLTCSCPRTWVVRAVRTTRVEYEATEATGGQE